MLTKYEIPCLPVISQDVNDMQLDVTVLIPTIGRPYLLKQVFNGLTYQSFTDFRVLLIMRPDDFESLKVVEHFNGLLDIKVIFQKRHGLIEAYNEGIRNASGDIIVFFDDDAVPDSNCIKEHILTYEQFKVFGVSGDVIPAHIDGDILRPIYGSSEVLKFYKEPNILRFLGDKLWNRPLNGQENYLVYISRSGYSNKNINLPYNRGIVNSLLCMAANMSVRSLALKNLCLSSQFLKRGINFEQVIGWQLWKKGHRMVFNPKAKVYHIQHGQTVSRSLNARAITQAIIEEELLFYYLLPKENKLSKMHRTVSILYRSLIHTKKIKENRKYEMAVLKGIILGNIIGLKWLISRKIGGKYIPLKDLEKF